MKFAGCSKGKELKETPSYYGSVSLRFWELQICIFPLQLRETEPAIWILNIEMLSSFGNSRQRMQTQDSLF